MEREKLIRWKKIGGGSLRLGNRLIKPGQVFTARAIDIPESFRDVIIPLEDLPEEPEIQAVEETYELVHRGGGYYNVVNSATGKIMNESALRKEAAESLKSDLSG